MNNGIRVNGGVGSGLETVISVAFTSTVILYISEPVSYTHLLTRLQKLALPTVLTRLSYENTLQTVAKESRWAGTPGEQAAAREIAAAMKSWGYEVTEQAFDFTDTPQGKQTSKQATNVIAVKKASKNPTGDILIISAHHDSMPSTCLLYTSRCV